MSKGRFTVKGKKVLDAISYDIETGGFTASMEGTYSVSYGGKTYTSKVKAGEKLSTFYEHPELIAARVQTEAIFNELAESNSDDTEQQKE